MMREFHSSSLLRSLHIFCVCMYCPAHWKSSSEKERERWCISGFLSLSLLLHLSIWFWFRLEVPSFSLSLLTQTTCCICCIGDDYDVLLCCYCKFKEERERASLKERIKEQVVVTAKNEEKEKERKLHNNNQLSLEGRTDAVIPSIRAYKEGRREKRTKEQPERSCTSWRKRKNVQGAWQGRLHLGEWERNLFLPSCPVTLHFYSNHGRRERRFLLSGHLNHRKVALLSPSPLLRVSLSLLPLLSSKSRTFLSFGAVGKGKMKLQPERGEPGKREDKSSEAREFEWREERRESQLRFELCVSDWTTRKKKFLTVQLLSSFLTRGNVRKREEQVSHHSPFPLLHPLTFPSLFLFLLSKLLILVVSLLSRDGTRTQTRARQVVLVKFSREDEKR